MKAIAGYENQYSVTEDGQVWSHKRDCFLVQQDLKGYKRVGLRDVNNGSKKKVFCVHRLVAQAFLPNPECKNEVNHINSDRSDNRVSNLEWVTRSENNQHAWTHGNKEFHLTKNHVSQQKRKLSKAEVVEIKNKYSDGGISQLKLSKQYGVSQATISHLVRGNTYAA